MPDSAMLRLPYATMPAQGVTAEHSAPVSTYGPPIAAGPGCTPVTVDPTQVTCDLGAPANALGLVVNVRDGADTVISNTAIGLLASGGSRTSSRPARTTS